MSKHPIVHIEISAKDREAAGRFYTDLFGWEVQQMPESNYATFSTGEGEVGGGFSPLMDNNPAGTTTVYVGTDDIDATLAKAVSLGGQILVSKTEIPGMGWFGIFKDLTGNMVGLFTEIPH